MRGASFHLSGRLAPLLAACLPLFPVHVADAAKLPKQAPVPEILRPAEQPDMQPPPDEVKLPENAPLPPPTPLDSDAPASAPAEPPKPEFRPDRPPPGDPPRETEPAEPAPPPDPRSVQRADPSGILPEAEAACRRRLTGLGVTFKEGKSQADDSGCSMPYPLVITSLGEVAMEPQAEMNCAMTEAAARFARDVISPAAKEIFGETLKSVAHASAYVCRPRNGTRKLSEHAFGNALDIASFTLSGGTTVVVEPDPPEKNGRFLDRVRAAACGPFKTVLGPGAADHSEHLHFDLAPRRNGGTVCE